MREQTGRLDRSHTKWTGRQLLEERTAWQTDRKAVLILCTTAVCGHGVVGCSDFRQDACRAHVGLGEVL